MIPQNTNSQIAVVGADGKLANIAPPQACKDFVAGKLGLTIPQSTKDNPFTMKDLTALATVGKTDDEAAAIKKQIAGFRKELDAQRKGYHAASAVFAAAVAADPRFRKTVRSSFDKHKEVNGWNVSVRRERSASVGAATKVAQLEATIARLTALLGEKALTA